jgi:hypothetical protein
MSEYSAAEGAPAEESAGHVSVPLTLAAAILSGLGIFGTFYWLLTFNWIWFPSVLGIAGGCYLLFTRITGPDHA